MAVLLKVSIFLGLIVVVCDGQGAAVANNIYDALQPLGCTRFLAILNKCRDTVKGRYKDDMTWTLFAANDTAFNNLPPSKLTELLNMTPEQSENYIMSFTLQEDLLTTQFRETEPKQSRSPLNTMIFFMRRARKEGNSASGIAGPTEYYANGARVVRPDISAGRAIIHVIDRVLEIPNDKSILGYISLAGQPDTAFYSELVDYISGTYYDGTVDPLNSYKRITAFIPTTDALRKIPREKLEDLRGNPERLNEVVRMHIIPDNVMFTSFVYHNEGIRSLGRGQIIFRTSKAREAVFVSSGGVTAEITHGNITCKNGAVHFIDTLLGYVYNSAKDEIEVNPLTQTFEELLIRARQELQQEIVSPSGVTLFVSVNEAFQFLPDMYNLARNQSLINKIIELSLVELRQEFELTTVNGDYEARQTLISSYNNHLINVYSQGNETWIESGYVKARVVRPDVGVTNGFIHFIDAVPGVPSHDLPNTIFCENWLIKSSWHLSVTGLNDYMRDTKIRTIAPCTTGGGVRSVPNVYDPSFLSSQQQSQFRTSMEVCRYNCYFTVFVPNGTAIENFENMLAGMQIVEDMERWRYVLARHITRQVIYLDRVAIGTERIFFALNGDEVRYRRVTQRYAYLYYQGKQSRVLHSDLGGTNGVIHIIDQVIFVSEDLYRTDLSWKSTSTGVHFVASFSLCVFCVYVWHCLSP